MQRRRLKTVVFVKLFGAVVKRMHQQRSGTGVLANDHSRVDCTMRGEIGALQRDFRKARLTKDEFLLRKDYLEHQHP